MDFTEVHAYISQLSFADSYMNKEEPERQKVVFTAEELLKDEFRPSLITTRAIALQAVYMCEGEDEEFSKYKRHGVKNFSTKGVSVSFEANDIAPSVLKLLGRNKASVGRLI